MQYSNSIMQSGPNLFSTKQSKRFVIGSPKSQATDYRYNNRNWLIYIYHHNLSQSAPSQDNNDRFGMQIGYDVKALIGSQQNMPQNWNGNVSWFAYRISGVTVPGTNSQRVGYAFWYDKANRLEKANFGFFNISWQTTDRYNVRDILYHKNGNITALKRYNQSGNLLHNYTYNYYEDTNRLRRVTGRGDNYDYDHKGNMIQDLANGIGFVIYDIHNLPVRVFTTNGAPRDYAYDHNGNRVRKYNGVETNYYLHGIDGRTEVVTDKASSWATYNLYGLDQIGQIRREGATWNRFYFLKDHLGSVRVIVDTSGNVVAYDDYYPFGLQMPGRTQDSAAVDGRYKFTGKERDTETKYDYFGARYYDARIGRWLQVDPSHENTPGISPYVYGRNNPLVFLDPKGAQEYKITVRTWIPYKSVFPFRGDARGPMIEGGTHRTQQVSTVRLDADNIIQSHRYETGLTIADLPIPGSLSRIPVPLKGHGEFGVEAARENGGIQVLLMGSAEIPVGEIIREIGVNIREFSIDYKFIVTISETGEVVIVDSHKEFPGYEVYVTDVESGKIIDQYIRPPERWRDFWKLFLERESVE